MFVHLKKLALRRLVRGAAAAVLVTGGLVAAGGSPAQAACSRPLGPFPNGEGAVVVDNGTVELHSGPFGECPVVARATSPKDLWVWCTYINKYHNNWAYVRIEGTQTKAWVWVDDDAVSWADWDDDGDTDFEYEYCP